MTWGGIGVIGGEELRRTKGDSVALRVGCCRSDASAFSRCPDCRFVVESRAATKGD